MLRRFFRAKRNEPEQGERTIIAHGHIFKNAGSTLDWALKKNFGRSFVDHRDDEPMRKEGAAYLLDYVLERPDLKAISSHHLCHPLPQTDSISMVALYLLRHPIERVLSVYEFEKHQKGSTPGAVNAKKMSFPEYVEWRLEPDSGATIRNYQVRYLTGMHRFPRRPVRREQLDAALETASTALVGLVEELDQSFVEFERDLRQRGIADLDLAYVPQNVNENRPSTSAERIDRLRSQLGPALFAELEEANQYDSELHSIVSNRLASRRANSPDIEAKLADFRDRCARLA